MTSQYKKLTSAPLCSTTSASTATCDQVSLSIPNRSCPRSPITTSSLPDVTHVSSHTPLSLELSLSRSSAFSTDAPRMRHTTFRTLSSCRRRSRRTNAPRYPVAPVRKTVSVREVKSGDRDRYGEVREYRGLSRTRRQLLAEFSVRAVHQSLEFQVASLARVGRYQSRVRVMRR